MVYEDLSSIEQSVYPKFLVKSDNYQNINPPVISRSIQLPTMRVCGLWVRLKVEIGFGDSITSGYLWRTTGY
jgi:hypothetical protein